MSNHARTKNIRCTTEESILICKRLSLFLAAGVPIIEALSFMEEGAREPNKRLIQSLIASTTNGRTLAEGFAAFPKAFGAFIQSLVEIGETSGTLALCLHTCAKHLRARQELRGKVISALIYPAIIIVATIGVSSFLTLYAFPKMMPILKGFRMTLPFPTRVLIGINDLVAHFALYIVILLCAVIVAGIYMLRDERIRARIDDLILLLPLFGSLARLYELTTASRTLALLLKGGTRIVPALELVQRSAENRTYKRRFADVRKDVLDGGRLASAFRKYPTVFPFILIQMTGAGEATGTLPESLASVGDIYEQELDELTKGLTTLIEPVLMIVMGLVVGFVALAIITPIYRVTEGIDVSYHAGIFIA